MAGSLMPNQVNLVIQQVDNRSIDSKILGNESR